MGSPNAGIAATPPHGSAPTSSLFQVTEEKGRFSGFRRASLVAQPHSTRMFADWIARSSIA